MIRSMTGYGSSTLHNEVGEFAVEVKSLNNRFLDVGVRLPRELGFLELTVRDEVKARVRRGKVDVFLRWAPAPGTQPLYELNTSLLQHYVQQVRATLGENTPVDAGAFISLPGVVNPTHLASHDNQLEGAVLIALRDALDKLDQSRAAEGESLLAAMMQHLEKLEKMHAEVSAHKDTLLEDFRSRLREKFEALARSAEISPDPARMETELMIYADRSDITEELVRLGVHFKAFRELGSRKSGDQVGKSMDFIVQELLREVNTIGNKARGAAVASHIVQMKSEIEKIREQVQNLE